MKDLQNQGCLFLRALQGQDQSEHLEQIARQAKWSLGILKHCQWSVCKVFFYWPHWQPEFLRTLRRGLRNQPNTSGWGKINDHSGAITSHGCLPWAEGSSKTCHLANPFLFEVSEDTRTWGRKCQEVWMHLKHSEVSALYWEAEMCWTMTNQQNDFHTSSKIQTGSSQFWQCSKCRGQHDFCKLSKLHNLQ